MPIVKPVALIVSVPPVALPSAQVTFVPVHANPERKSTTASNVEEPVTFIVGVAVVATNLYQTSSSGVPPQPVIDELVAPTVVPVVVIHVVFCVNRVGVAHASLAGLAVAPYTQMVNVPAVEVVAP